MPDNPAEAAVKSTKNAGKWFSKRTFGMPRWAFLALAAGGVGIGLYLRSRNTAADEVPPEDVTDVTDPYAQYASDTGELAGLGAVPTGSSGSVVPVDSPFIPEGFSDVVGILGDVIMALGDPAYANPDAFVPDSPGNDGAGDFPTGGGPPTRRSNRVLGELTGREIRKLPKDIRDDARRYGRDGITKSEQRALLDNAGSRKERQQIRRQIQRGQGHGGRHQNTNAGGRSGGEVRYGGHRGRSGGRRR